jgi:hypothetical protein
MRLIGPCKDVNLCWFCVGRSIAPPPGEEFVWGGLVLLVAEDDEEDNINNGTTTPATAGLKQRWCLCTVSFPPARATTTAVRGGGG